MGYVRYYSRKMILNEAFGELVINRPYFQRKIRLFSTYTGIFIKQIPHPWYLKNSKIKNKKKKYIQKFKLQAT